MASQRRQGKSTQSNRSLAKNWKSELARLKKRGAKTKKFLQSIEEADLERINVATSLREIISLNDTVTNEVEDLRNELMEQMAQLDERQEERLEEQTHTMHAELDEVHANFEDHEDAIGEIHQRMQDEAQSREAFEESVEHAIHSQQTVIATNAEILDNHEDRIEANKQDIANERERAHKAEQEIANKLDLKVRELNEKRKRLRIGMNKKMRAQANRFDTKIKAARKHAEQLTGQARDEAIQVAQDLERQAKRERNKLAGEIQAGEEKFQRGIAAARDQSRREAIELNAQHQGQLDKIRGRLDNHEHRLGNAENRLDDHERRLKQLEMSLGDGSVVKVVRVRGSYKLVCMRHANQQSGNPKGNKRISCNVQGTDNYQQRFYLDRQGAETKVIPKGLEDVRDTITIRDTEGNVSTYKIIFASGSQQASLTKIGGGISNTLLIKMNGGSFKENSSSAYSYIVDPTNNQILNIFSDQGKSLLKKYIKQIN